MPPLIRRSRSAVPGHAREDGGCSGLGSYPTARYGSACLSTFRCAGTASPRVRLGGRVRALPRVPHHRRDDPGGQQCQQLGL